MDHQWAVCLRKGMPDESLTPKTFLAMIPYRVPCTNQFTKKLEVAGKCGSFNKMNALKTHYRKYVKNL
jgi:hypothetical protein